MMKTFETTEEVLVGAREVHARACELYSKLSSEAQDQQALSLLNVLCEHESRMADKLTGYLAHAPMPLLQTWTPFSLPVEPRRFFRGLGARQDMSACEIAELSEQIEAYVHRLFAEMSATIQDEDVRLVFRQVTALASEERRRVSLSRERLANC